MTQTATQVKMAVVDPDIEDTIASYLESVRALRGRIAEINRQIAERRESGGGTARLRQRRQWLYNEVAELKEDIREMREYLAATAAGRQE